MVLFIGVRLIKDSEFWRINYQSKNYGMERDKYKKIYEEFRDADKKYWDYIEQFFAQGWNDKVDKKATKMLNQEELKKIKDLQKKVDIARKALNEFFGIKPRKK